MKFNEIMRKEKSVNEIASRRSDEFRVPLSSILGYIKLIRENDNLDVAVTEHLSVIESTTQHLLSFVNNLETQARFRSTDKVKLTTHSVSLEDLLVEINQIASPLAKKKNLLFSTSITPRCSRYGALDIERVKQMLLNLIRSSISYTKEGFVNLTLDQEGSDLVFTVIDSGLGLHEEEIRNIENAHVDGENETKTGLGLSLSVSKSLVEAMKGSFEVKSKVGEGSTITVTIPHKESEEVSQHEATQEIPVFDPKAVESSKMTILLMESSIESSNFISFLLKRSGYEVTVAEDWELALAFLDALEFDIVIADLNMTDLSNAELIKTVRGIGYQKDLIAIVEDNESQSQEELKKLGFATSISKPIQMTELLTVFKRLIPLTG